AVSWDRSACGAAAPPARQPGCAPARSVGFECGPVSGKLWSAPSPAAGQGPGRSPGGPGDADGERVAGGRAAAGHTGSAGAEPGFPRRGNSAVGNRCAAAEPAPQAEPARL